MLNSHNQGYKKFGHASYIFSLGLTSLTIVSGLLLSSSISHADEPVVDEVSITIPVACTFSSTGQNTHSTTITPGNYVADIGTTTMKAMCNDGGGFAIYAAGYTGNAVGGANSNKLVGTNNSSFTISTNLNTSGDSGWAMKLATDSNATYPITIDSAPNTSGGADATFTNYHVVPNEYTKVAHRASGTDVGTNAEGSTFTSTYAVNISSAQIADTYTGQVIYTLVHPQTAPVPIACNPNATTISQAKCMQDFVGNSASITSSMTPEQQYTLKDSRDGKEYYIAKLADGNVWMTQNLDFDIDSSKTYTNLDTDLGWNSTTNQYETASWTPMRSTYPTGTTTWDETIPEECFTYYSYGYEDEYCIGFYGEIHPESYDPGNKIWDGVPNNDYPPTITLDNMTQGTNLHYSIGNYYNWTAAAALNDSINYGYSSYGSETEIYDTVDQSICPAGWTLPGGGYSDSHHPKYNDLLYAYDWDGWTIPNMYPWQDPFYFSLSGAWTGREDHSNGGTVAQVGTVYEDTVYSSCPEEIDTDASGGIIEPDCSHGKNIGFSVRCVARPTTSNDP